MPESRSHRTTSIRIAKKLDGTYNSNKGVHSVTPNIAVEVETENTVASGVRQLQGHKKRVYIAGTNKKAVERALKATERTTIGVMNSEGRIVKQSSRKKS